MGEEPIRGLHKHSQEHKSMEEGMKNTMNYESFYMEKYVTWLCLSWLDTDKKSPDWKCNGFMRGNIKEK